MPVFLMLRLEDEYLVGIVLASHEDEVLQRVWKAVIIVSFGNYIAEDWFVNRVNPNTN